MIEKQKTLCISAMMLVIALSLQAQEGAEGQVPEQEDTSFNAEELPADVETPEDVGTTDLVKPPSEEPNADVSQKAAPVVQDPNKKPVETSQSPAAKPAESASTPVKDSQPKESTVQTKPADVGAAGSQSAATKPPETTAKDSGVKKEPEELKEELEALTTDDLKNPQGNWLFKRIWGEKAQVSYEKIKKLVGEIIDSRMQFFAQRNELDRTVLDPFYVAIGIGQGELQELLAYLTEELDKERQKDGVLSDQEKDLLNKLGSEKQELQKLKASVDAITKLDEAIDDALAKLMEQINVCRGHEKKSWDNLKSIAKELSDKVARDLFYTMETAWDDVKKVDGYIKNEFTSHFNQLMSKTKEQVGTVKTQLQALKEKGIDFKKQLRTLDEQEEKALKEQQVRSEQEREKTRKAAQEALEREAYENRSIVTKVWDATTGMIGSAYDWVKGLFGFGASHEEEVVPVKAATASVPKVPAPQQPAVPKPQSAPVGLPNASQAPKVVPDGGLPKPMNVPGQSSVNPLPSSPAVLPQPKMPAL